MPSCETCNAVKGGQDDEYFRRWLATNELVEQHPQGKLLLTTELRAFARPEGVGLTQKFIGSILPGMKIAGRSNAQDGIMPYKFEKPRIARVGSRTALGLFFHETGERVPPGYVAVGFVEPGAEIEQDAEAQGIADVFKAEWESMLAYDAKVIGDGAFTYRWKRDGGTADATWALDFYGAVRIIVKVRREDDIAARFRNYAKFTFKPESVRNGCELLPSWVRALMRSLTRAR